MLLWICASFWLDIFISLEYMLENGVQIIRTCFIFWEVAKLFSKVDRFNFFQILLYLYFQKGFRSISSKCWSWHCDSSVTLRWSHCFSLQACANNYNNWKLQYSWVVHAHKFMFMCGVCMYDIYCVLYKHMSVHIMSGSD